MFSNFLNKLFRKSRWDLKSFLLISIPLFFVISFFIVSFLIFDDRMIGHRMDWSIPIESESISNFLTDNLYKWRDQNLGFQKIFYTNFTLLESLIGLMGLIGFDGVFLSRFIIFLPIFIAGVSMSVFLRTVSLFWFKKEADILLIMIVSLFYATSYAMFNQIIGGNYGITISAAFAPLTLTLFIYYLEKKKIIYLIITSIFLSFSIFQIHYIFYLLLVFIILFLLFYRTIESFKKMVALLFLSLALNSFWLFDFISIFSKGSTISDSMVNSSWLAGLEAGKNTILDGIYLTGWGTSHLEVDLPLIFYFSSTFILLISLMTLINFSKNNKEIKKIVSYFLLFLLFLLFLFTGIREPFLNLKEWVCTFPGMTFFKSPQHNLLPFTMILSFLLYTSLIYTKLKYLYVLVFITIIISNYNFTPWIFNEHFNKYDQSALVTKGNYFIDDSDLYRVMFIPAARAPFIPDNKFKPKVGFDADAYFFKKNSFFTEDFEDSTIGPTLEKNIYFKDFSSDDLNLMNIKYIFLRSDRAHGNVDYGNIFWNKNDLNESYDLIYSKFLKKDFLKKVSEFNEENKNFSIWENTQYSFRLESESDISFSRINRTMYNVKISNLDKETAIILKENYDIFWNIYLERNFKSKFLCDPKNFKESVTECVHYEKFRPFNDLKYLFLKKASFQHTAITNNYGNRWTIDAEYIKKNFDNSFYKENPDGSIDIELTLYFKPQSYFYLGLIISGITLLFCITYLVWYAGRQWIVQRRRKDVL